MAILFYAAVSHSQPSGSTGKSNAIDRPLLFLGNEFLPPLIYKDKDKPIGVVVDLAHALKSRMSRPVEFRCMDWSQAQQLVLEGKADALLQINPSEERKKIYDFSDTLLESEFSIFISSNREGIYDVAGLRGLTVAVEERGLPILLLKRDPAIQIASVPNILQGFQMMLEGAAQAVVADRWAGLYVLAQNNLRNIRIAGEPIDRSHSAIAVKKGNTQLLAQIDKALVEIKKDGTYTQILARWKPKEIVFQTKEQYFRQKTYLVATLGILLALFLSGVFLLKETRRRKKAIENLEKALADGEHIAQQRQLALDAARMGWWHYDPVSRIASWDDRCKEIFGLTGNRHPDDEILKRLHPDDLPGVWAKVVAALNPQDPRPYSAQYRINLPDGSMKWIEAHGLASFAGDGDQRRATRLVGTVTDITERRQAADALAASEEKYRELLETANSIIMRWDTQGVIRFINGFGLRFFGYLPEELLGQDVMRLVPHVEKSTGRDLAALVKDIVNQPERHADVSNENLTKDGRTVWVAWTHKAILDDQGKVQEILAIGNDITPMKEAEQSLRESERRLSLAVSATADAIWEWNLATQQTYFSPRWYEMLGYENAEISMNFDAWRDLCHPEDFQPTMALIQSRLNSTDDQGYAAEFRMRAKNGAWVWILGRGRVVERDEAGKPRLLSGTNTDITERKKAEAALKESELRFRLALRNAPVSVAAQDRDLRYIWAYNQGTVGPEEIIGHFDEEIFTTEEAAHLKSIKRRVLEGNVELREQMWFNRPSGQLFLDVCWEPIRDETGRVSGVASAAVDLTPIKIAEEALKSSLAEKEVLLKEIHHRVKNNMQVISSLMSLQANELQDGAMRAVLKDVMNRVRSMAIVHEKLYQSPNLARIDFGEYCQSLLSYLWRAHEITVSDIQLDLDLAPIELPVNEAVPCGLILNELFSNALKHAFCGRSKGRVTVSLHAREQTQVHLGVRDNGIGLPAGFEWRTARSLGLRLVQMLAAQLHAAVKVETGEGTEFVITFKSSQSREKDDSTQLTSTKMAGSH